MPVIAVLFSLFGLLPFVFFGIGAVGHIPETAERMLVSLIDYASLILAFAGGVHWGLALLPAAARPSVRFAAGVVPLIVAWIALVVAQMVSPWVALALLILGYLATVLTEQRAARNSFVPSGYMWVRWLFSVVAVVIMVIVLVLRGIGQTIVF